MWPKIIAFSALALLLAFQLAVGNALAYFTAHVETAGGHPIFLNRQTEIREEVTDWKKSVTIISTGDAPCFVRARAYCGSIYSLSFFPGEKWEEQDDGWWYYTSPLAPGEQTSVLEIAIDSIPVADRDNPPDFHVIVVQEHTAALYREDGTPYADWSLSSGSTPHN